MTRLERARDKALIPEVFRDPRRIDKMLTLLVPPGTKRDFDSGYWKRAKKRLTVESGGKCAYCEAPTATVAHGDVEHFRPKAIYWWLAYCYDNFLYACHICNEAHKRDNFPLAGKKKPMSPVPFSGSGEPATRAYLAGLAPDPLDDPSVKKFQMECLAEKALLLNPYFDDPDRHFIWEADPVTRAVWVRPKGKASIPYHRAAEEFYGLNRDELLNERWRVYLLLETLRDSYREPRLEGTPVRDKIAERLGEMIDPKAPFAGMCRYFVKKRWKLPV